MSPVNIDNTDNFETSKLFFSFELSNYVEYKDVLTLLNENTENVTRIFISFWKRMIYINVNAKNGYFHKQIENSGYDAVFLLTMIVILENIIIKVYISLK